MVSDPKRTKLFLGQVAEGEAQDESSAALPSALPPVAQGFVRIKAKTPIRYPVGQDDKGMLIDKTFLPGDILDVKEADAKGFLEPKELGFAHPGEVYGALGEQRHQIVRAEKVS